MQILNIGIIGTASIAAKAVIPAIKNLTDKYKIAGIASRTLKSAEALADSFSIPSYSSYEAILDKNIVDAVYIPLPNSLHFEWVKKSLEKGIHVLVEKSMGISKKEVETLNDIARENKLILVENFQFRFHEQLSIIKEIVADGKIGELRCFRSTFCFPPFQDKTNIRYKKELGGGALLDTGAYPLKVAQIFLGKDIEVTSAKMFFDPNYNVDTWGGAFLKQKEGPLFAEVAFGFDQFYQCNIELLGSKGKLYTNRLFTAPPNFEPEIILETATGKELIQVKADNHFQNILSHFHRLIIEGGDDIEEEYMQNINQARLIEELKIKANEE